ncbi:MAG: hypothetical protein FWD05_13945 [Oscillospiraceae bacterium]|nr:hypothetical protein [Oscillospiraceae bacterium]
MIRTVKKWAAFALVAIIAVAVTFIIVSSILLSPTFVFRILTRWDASVEDYRFFPYRAISASEYVGTFLESQNIGYGYMWYSRPSASGGLDFWAMGRFGQFLYISPANNTVIVRTGSTTRIDGFNFSEVLAEIAVLVDE